VVRKSNENNFGSIDISPIGIIHTPFENDGDAPFQGNESPENIGQIEIFPEFVIGLEGIEKYKFIVLIFYFHLRNEAKLTVIPRKSIKPRGVFTTRAPSRPNHIGITTVRLISVDKNILTVSGIDMLDGTPLLDIKPALNSVVNV